MNKGNSKHEGKSKQTVAVYRRIMMSISVVFKKMKVNRCHYNVRLEAND